MILSRNVHHHTIVRQFTLEQSQSTVQQLLHGSVLEQVHANDLRHIRNVKYEFEE